MRICLIHGPLGQAFRDLGHEVLQLAPPPGVFDIRAALDEAGFVPDLLVHTESLGPRVLLAGLPAVAAIKIFWSLDTHLNAFWHAHYGGLFDAVATTQPAWVPRLAVLGPARVFALPVCGWVLPWKPFARRGREVAFCGRIGASRPLRQRFADRLRETFQAEIAGELHWRAMLDLYADTRIVPNESIAGEINFRMFEAASCGCAVLTPAGRDVAAVFTPGEEVETYADGLELEEKLRGWLADPETAQRVGLRARKRVLAEHLPAHRARTILETLPDLDRSAARGEAASLLFQLTLVDLFELRQALVDPDALARGLAGHPDRPEAMVGLLRLFYCAGRFDELDGLLARLVREKHFPGDAALCATASLAALRRGEWELAKLFWHRHHRREGRPCRLPERPEALLRTWAGVWTRLGREVRVGFEYDLTRHLPQSGLETLILAYSRDPGDLSLVRAMDSLLAGYPGSEETRLAMLSELSLHERDNWRLGLRLGLVNLRAFRTGQGLDELRLAATLADRAGEAGRFAAALTHEDHSGAIRRALRGAG